MNRIRKHLFALVFPLLLPLVLFASTGVYADDNTSQTQIKLSVSEVDLHWIGERIATNETANKIENLTYWNPKEPFPSFGIGHFIWIPQGVKVPFEQTFPEMVAYVSKAAHLIAPEPKWLANLKPFVPLWQSREVFMAQFNQAELVSLRHWLDETKTQQADFILHRFQMKLNEGLSGLPLTEQWKIKETVELMTTHRKSLYALLDYFNFKGLGNNPKERYSGKGWGLLDVLIAMPEVTTHSRLDDFIQTAKRLLKQRVDHAPTAKQQVIEQKWLEGWNHRLEGYLR